MGDLSHFWVLVIRAVALAILGFNLYYRSAHSGWGSPLA